MHGPIGEEHEFLQAYRAHYDEIPQPVETEPRTGIRPQEKGIGCKKSHGETQGRGPAHKYSNLTTTAQSQGWACENNAVSGARA